MSTEIREALTAAGAAAGVPKIIDPMLLEYQRRYSPYVRAIPSQRIASTQYYFNQRTNLGGGGFVTDGGARPVTNSTYVQQQFTVRNMQTIGAVTGYAQQVTAEVLGDLRRREIEGAIQGQYMDMENACMWGNSPSTVTGPYPQFDGLDTQISTYSGSQQNAIDVNAALSLGWLDRAADLLQGNAAMAPFGAEWMFVMSPTAMSRVAQLLQAQQRFSDRVEVAAGLLVPTYRNIPLVVSSYLGTNSIQMGTVTSATATTGGTLAAATYYYVVSAVIARSGETIGSVEVSQATTGSTSTVTLSFAAPTGYEGAGPILYKVYRSTGTGTESLLGYVDATVVLQGDGITPTMATSIVDTGSALIPKNSSTAPTTPPTAYYGTNTGAKPLASGQENIYLQSRSRDFVLRPYVRELQPVDVFPTTASPDTLPFALVTDTCLAVRAPKYATRLGRVTVALSTS
ncbi:hypothetical protein [Embleya sp. NPDC005971]|uniref:hypothetical protein n=1 Tax=Embleya sp. NPDC005971 TaxID=3156724 RepID=UPI0033ECF6CF